MGTFGCRVWKTIRRLWSYFNNISIGVANGLKTAFWNEVWVGKVSYLSPTLLQPTSTSSKTIHSQPLTPPHWSIHASFFICLNHFSHIFCIWSPLHLGHSHLDRNIFIYNSISPNKPHILRAPTFPQLSSFERESS